MSINYWGLLMIIIGILLFIWGLTKSNFIIYRLFVARSKMLWGNNVHKFYQVAGILVIIAGILVTTGIL